MQHKSVFPELIQTPLHVLIVIVVIVVIIISVI